MVGLGGVAVSEEGGVESIGIVEESLSLRRRRLREERWKESEADVQTGCSRLSLGGSEEGRHC